MGECTAHARTHGGGIGIFFLVHKCMVVIIHEANASYAPCIYVDE